MALAFKDLVAKSMSYTFNSYDEVDQKGFSEKSLGYIKMAFRGNPYKVIVEIIDDTLEGEDKVRGLDSVLKDLENRPFNYLSIPTIKDEEEKQQVADWISKVRQKGKMRKAVLPLMDDPDNKAVINFKTTGIKEKEIDIDASEYTSRLAGVFAGLPLTQSSTYYKLEELTSIATIDNPDEVIDNGGLILINDGNKIKIARGVNSMVTVGENDIESFNKIKVLEISDMIHEDIWQTWEEYYSGKVSNTYINKVLFLNTINDYLKNLMNDGILDNDVEAYLQIDIEEQKKFLKNNNIDYTEMSEQQIKEANTGSYLFAEGQIRIADAMEDLKIKLYV